MEAEGITFAIGNGISANRYRVADLSETMQLLNYRPIDDAWADRTGRFGGPAAPVDRGTI